VLVFFDWAYRNGGKFAEELDYVPMPMTVDAGSQSFASAILKRPSCNLRPECGPKHEAPWSLSARKPLHAFGRLSSRRVCPVGAASKTM
jgi:hypothetical protein